MSNNIKTLFTTLGATGIIATGGLIYTHDKTLKADRVDRKEELDLAWEQLDLNKNKLELEKFKQNIPSIYDQVKPPVQHISSTPVTDHLNSIDTTKFLGTVQESNILHMPDQPVQLAGLALLCYTLGSLFCLLLLLLNNYQENKDLSRLIDKFPPVNKLLSIYRVLLRVSNLYTLAWLVFFSLAQIFIALYLLLFLDIK